MNTRIAVLLSALLITVVAPAAEVDGYEVVAVERSGTLNGKVLLAETLRKESSSHLQVADDGSLGGVVVILLQRRDAPPAPVDAEAGRAEAESGPAAVEDTPTTEPAVEPAAEDPASEDSATSTSETQLDPDSPVVPEKPAAPERPEEDPDRPWSPITSGRAWPDPASEQELAYTEAGFAPGLVLLQPDEALSMVNELDVTRTFRTAGMKNPDRSLALPGGSEESLAFTRAEWISISCAETRTHRALLVVGEHPYVTVTGDDGSYRIEGVPPGEYRLEVRSGSFLPVSSEIVLVETAVETDVPQITIEKLLRD